MVGRCNGATTAASGVSFWPCQILILYFMNNNEKEATRNKNRQKI
ncbi:MAG: hypothetical protein ACJ71J_08185 [Nitrososphaeraceae archaeon]